MPETKLNIQTLTAPNFSGLEASGYVVQEVFYRGFFDGFSAQKTVKDKTVEVYVGSDNGVCFFTPQAYVDGVRIGEASTPDKAARMAEIGAMFRNRNSNRTAVPYQLLRTSLS